MSSQVDGDRSGTVEVTLRFWRNCGPEGQRSGSFHSSGDYLPDGMVWPTGTVYVPKQKHAPRTGERHVNHSFEWMGAIRDALKDAGVTMVAPEYPE
jgi:hypothetical protein